MPQTLSKSQEQTQTKNVNKALIMSPSANEDLVHQLHFLELCVFCLLN